MEEKKEIRKLITEKKKQYTEDQLKELSSVITGNVKENVVLKCAKTVLLYYSLPDEVFTHDFVEILSQEKTVLLPVVKGDDLELRVYTGKECLQKGGFNIDEPQGEFYDRFLKKLNTFKIGVCFGFQLSDEIPHGEYDVAMDEVWTEDGYVSKK